MDALVGGALPPLDEQQLVLILRGEIVVVGKAARLVPDQGEDARLYKLPDKGLAAAVLGHIAHIQCQLFFHGAPPE